MHIKFLTNESGSIYLCGFRHSLCAWSGGKLQPWWRYGAPDCSDYSSISIVAYVTDTVFYSHAVPKNEQIFGLIPPEQLDEVPVNNSRAQSSVCCVAMKQTWKSTQSEVLCRKCHLWICCWKWPLTVLCSVWVPISGRLCFANFFWRITTCVMDSVLEQHIFLCRFRCRHRQW